MMVDEVELRFPERVEARLDRPSMTAGRPALKARGRPPICCANRFPPRPLRGAPLCSAALTAAPPPVLRTPFSMVRTLALEVIMRMGASIGTAPAKITEDGMARLIAGLDVEFGRGAGKALARHVMEAEEADFLWEARVQERWLGSYESVDDDARALDRIAICGRLDGRWFASVMLVDGDGMVHATLAKRVCRSRTSAYAAMVDAH